MQRSFYFKILSRLELIRAWATSVGTGQILVQESRYGDQVTHSITINDYVGSTDLRSELLAEFGDAVEESEFPTIADALNPTGR